MPDWLAVMADLTVTKKDLAFLLGIASLALEFCHLTETYPVFAEWLARNPDQPPEISQEQLKVADLVVTEYSHQLFGDSDARPVT